MARPWYETSLNITKANQNNVFPTCQKNSCDLKKILNKIHLKAELLK